MTDTTLSFTIFARDLASKVFKNVGQAADDTKKEADSTSGSFGKLAGSIAGIAASVPQLSALAVGVGGLAAGAASAGMAIGAFGAAAKPQLTDVTNAWTLYSAAQTAAATGGKTAAAANKAYADALAKMSPATRGTAVAFVGLQSDFKKWSDSLSGTTMPIFTTGINALRAALPALTPLVQVAAKALGGFMDQISAGASSGAFKKWIADFAAAAGPMLTGALTVIKNLAIGFASLLHAFLPMSTGMTGGLVKLSDAFAKWAKGLENSQGFTKFLAMANTGKGALGNLGLALINLFNALKPFMGTTTIIATELAKLITALPPSVISLLAQAFIYVSIAMKAWTLATTIWSGVTKAAGIVMKAWTVATTIWSGVTKAAAAAQWLLNVAMDANPIGLIVIAIVGLIAIIVLIATKTTWFQTLWKVTWSAIKTALSASWSFIKAVFSALGSAASSVGGFFASMYNSVKSRISSVVSLVKSIPGAIASVFSGAGNWLWNAGESIIRGLINGVESAINGLRSLLNSVTSWIPSWKGPPEKDAKLLAPAGQLIMGGLIDGIEGQVGALKSTLGDVTSTVQVTPLAPSSSLTAAVSGSNATASGGTAVQVQWVGGNAGDDFMKWLRKNIRVVSGGGPASVQKALG